MSDDRGKTDDLRMEVTFLDATPWWERITPEQWDDMSATERRLTLAAVPPRIGLFSKDDGRVVLFESDLALAPGGLRSGDSVTITCTVTMT